MRERVAMWWASLAAAGILSTTAQAVFVTVGDAGNAGELSGAGAGGFGPDVVVGSVAYEYRISQFEVTAGEWRDFLNAADPEGTNSLGLYNATMDSFAWGCQITLNPGNPSGLKYDFSGRPSGSESDWTDRPVDDVSWPAAARYCNWLTNGRPAGGGGTESGVYQFAEGALDSILPHATAATALQVPVAYFLPTEDEWYKAAYYDPALNGGLGGYWDYATGSDAAPDNQLIDPDPGNHATFAGTLGSPYYRTVVGAHENSASPYGTFDQSGNAWEWNETLIGGIQRGIRGGSSGDPAGFLRADYRLFIDGPAQGYLPVGLRVASVNGIPEPGTLVLLAVGVAGCAARRKRTRRWDPVPIPTRAPRSPRE